MTKPEVQYDLHDSTIVGVSTGPQREVVVTIDLYPIFYLNKPRVRLRFGGIENFDAVQRYMDSIRQEADDEYIGCRIDAFHYDTKKESRSGDYWFFFQTAWCGPVRIHCSHMSMTELQSPSCEQSHPPEPAAGPDSSGGSSPPAR
jgi:hypothetical protein